MCGTYPRAVAEALLQAAQRANPGIRPSTGDDGRAGEEIGSDVQAVRRVFREPDALVGKAALVCDGCMLADCRQYRRHHGNKAVQTSPATPGMAFRRHPSGSAGRNLAAVSRAYARRRSGGGRQIVLIRASGFSAFSERHRYETLTFAALTSTASRSRDRASAIS